MSETVKVDVGALVAGIRIDVAHRIAIALGTSLQALHERDNAVNENQACELIEGALYAFDGFQRSCAEMIVRDFGRTGVELWGLPSELEDLVDA